MKPGQVRFTPVPDRRFHAKGLYGNFIPLPLVHLTDDLGLQHVHIAPEAFTVAKAEFPDQIKFWQDSLPGPLKGKLESVREQPFLRFLRFTDPVTQLNGARVLFIDGRSPYVAVDQNAAISGGFQGLGTRQNS
jgi:hypothetical protein